MPLSSQDEARLREIVREEMKALTDSRRAVLAEHWRNATRIGRLTASEVVSRQAGQD